MNLNPAIEVHIIQRGAHRGMLYFFYRVGTLDLRIHHAKAVFKKRWQVARCDVAVLVDGRGQYGPAVFPIPPWVVCTASKHGDAKRCACDNHNLCVSSFFDLNQAEKYNLPVVGAAHGVPLDSKRPFLGVNGLKRPF